LLPHNGILRRGVYPEPVEGLLRMTSAVVVLGRGIIQRCGELDLANSRVEPFDRAYPELVEGLRAGSLGGFGDVKDRLKPRLQQSERIAPQF
jgi:hypothetical protein